MYAFRIGLVALLSLFPARLFAQDISVYGGNMFVDGDDYKSVAASVGFDLPKTKQLLGMDQIRTDFTYAWNGRSFEGFTVSGLDGSSIVTTNGPVDFDTRHRNYGFYVGPSWRLENILGPVDFSVGVQAGVAHGTYRSETDPVVGNEFFNRKSSDTNFSYQFPVELEVPLFDRVSISARYRPVGVFDGGENGFNHVVEGGIKIKF